MATGPQSRPLPVITTAQRHERILRVIDTGLEIAVARRVATPRHSREYIEADASVRLIRAIRLAVMRGDDELAEVLL